MWPWIITNSGLKRYANSARSCTFGPMVPIVPMPIYRIWPEAIGHTLTFVAPLKRTLLVKQKNDIFFNKYDKKKFRPKILFDKK